jgi:peptide deformylase
MYPVWAVIIPSLPFSNPTKADLLWQDRLFVYRDGLNHDPRNSEDGRRATSQGRSSRATGNVRQRRASGVDRGHVPDHGKRRWRLAAPQIGVDLQLVIFGFDRSERYPDAEAVPRTILLNPVITPLYPAVEAGWEGCLSVPGLRGMVNRFQSIRYEGVDPDGQPVDRLAHGFHARVVQHECDHLIGRLYPSRITDFSKFGFMDVMFPDMDPNADD